MFTLASMFGAEQYLPLGEGITELCTHIYSGTTLQLGAELIGFNEKNDVINLQNAEYLLRPGLEFVVFCCFFFLLLISFEKKQKQNTLSHCSICGEKLTTSDTETWAGMDIK
jgi:hypothetical protein